MTGFIVLFSHDCITNANYVFITFNATLLFYQLLKLYVILNTYCAKVKLTKTIL